MTAKDTSKDRRDMTDATHMAARKDREDMTDEELREMAIKEYQKMHPGMSRDVALTNLRHWD